MLSYLAPDVRKFKLSAKEDHVVLFFSEGSILTTYVLDVVKVAFNLTFG